MFIKIALSILSLLTVSVAGQGEEQGNQNVANLVVRKKNAFGKNIKITFNNPLDTGYPWIGIFKDTGGLPLNKIPAWSLMIAWLNDCDSQEDCNSIVPKGSVTFSAKDPKSYYYSYYDYDGVGYFPFRDGKYIACFINQVYDSDDDGAEPYFELISGCKRFLVKKPNKKQVNGSKIVPVKSRIKRKKAFEAKFELKATLQNQWVGLYAAVNGKPPKRDLTGKAILWGYTGCPDQSGDQEQTTNCVKQKKKGKVRLNAKHLDTTNPDARWPVAKGAYYMCLNWQSNEPYDVFKCSTKITVV